MNFQPVQPKVEAAPQGETAQTQASGQVKDAKVEEKTSDEQGAHEAKVEVKEEEIPVKEQTVSVSDDAVEAKQPETITEIASTEDK